jgi:hypothetical protein
MLHVQKKEGSQAETVMEEEEQILKFVPTEGEHPIELLTQWEMKLKALEDWLDILEPEGGFQEISMLEETYQHELQLEEAGIKPVGELIRVSLFEEIAEQQFSGETMKLEFATVWPVDITRDESGMGDQNDLPMEQHEDLQSRRLHKLKQPMKQLEEAIEEIRELMLRSAEEVVIKGKLDRKEPTRAAGEMRQQRSGEERQLQEKVWDPRVFQQSWEDHEQKLMNFHSCGV